MKIYEQLKSLSLPLIEAYHNDLLKWDKEELEENPGVPFLHFTGKTGTNLLMMQPADHSVWPEYGERVPYIFGHEDRWGILAGKTAYFEATRDIADRNDLVLHFDGKILKKINMKEAENIVWQYRRKVESAWHRQINRKAA